VIRDCEMVVIDFKFVILIFFLHVVSSISSGNGIQWLGLRPHPQKRWRRDECARSMGLTSSKQIRACKNNINLMPFVEESIQLVKSECKEQFAQRIWDCSSIEKAPKFGFDLRSDTKESAFVYALASAAMTFTISKACFSGKLFGCSCSNKPIFVQASKANQVRQSDFGACPDITLKGIKFSRQFAFAELKKKHSKNPINQQRQKIKKHNIKLGGQVVRDLQSINCRCHGVTGACQLKHCMKRLPTFPEVATRLFKMYEKAVQIDLRQQRSGGKKFAARGKLVYADSSPNYCIADESLGTSGTTGRECLLSGAGNQSCEKLCCGQGYKRQRIETVENCRCKYVWCCYVKCEVCKSSRLQYTCM